jgi:hypothetical protein
MHAVALNQFNEPLASQPSISWQSSAGTVVGSLFTPPAVVGKYSVIASANGKSATAWVVVHRFPFLADSGYVKQLLLLERNNVPYIPRDTNGIDYNFLPNETTSMPSSGATASIGGTTWTWSLRSSTTGMWADSFRADNFVAYGAFYLYTPVSRKVIIRCKHDDALKIWFNTTQVYKQPYYDAFEHSSDPLALAPGLSRVLIKLLEGGSGNYFSIRFADSTGANAKKLGCTFSSDTNAIAPIRLRDDPAAKNGQPLMRLHGKSLFVIPGKASGSMLYIRDLHGRTVMSLPITRPSQKISLGNMPSGIFSIELSGENTIRKIYRGALVQSR